MIKEFVLALMVKLMMAREMITALVSNLSCSTNKFSTDFTTLSFIRRL